jgi:hypothetical protein
MLRLTVRLAAEADLADALAWSTRRDPYFVLSGNDDAIVVAVLSPKAGHRVSGRVESSLPAKNPRGVRQITAGDATLV